MSKLLDFINDKYGKELKPCPFCGCIAPKLVGEDCWRIECSECECMTKDYFEHPEKAFEAWQRRMKND